MAASFLKSIFNIGDNARVVSVVVEVLEVRGVVRDDDQSTRIYVISRAGGRRHRTSSKKAHDPDWPGNSFTFNLRGSIDDSITFDVWDEGHFVYGRHLGSAYVGIPYETGKHDTWLALSNPQKQGEIHVRISPTVPTVDPVGHIALQAPGPGGNLQSLLDDVKTLGLEDAASGAMLLLQTFADKDKQMNDRDGSVDRLIHLMAKLPTNSKLQSKVESFFIQALWDDIVKPARAQAGNFFRSADGSGNSVLYPWVGQSGSHYARTVTPLNVRLPTLPDSGDIFDMLFDRANQGFVPHPNNVNVLLFYLAALITHDLFYTDRKNPTVNSTTSYADLSPLYGRNQAEQDGVRTKKDGLLKPDAFADIRFPLQPPGVPVLVVIFSRNHNYIARKLKELNEGGRFASVTPTGLPVSDADLDEKLFQTARLINTGCYVNIILHDYLHAILGLDGNTYWVLNPAVNPPAYNPTGGNQVAVEFNFVYRWHSAIGQKDAQWAEDVVNEYLRLIHKLKNSTQTEKPPDFDEVLKQLAGSEQQWSLGTCIRHLDRKADGSFDNRQLGLILEEAIQQVAGKPGANHIPSVMRFIEQGAILQGRAAGCCSLNQFRTHLKLRPYESFRELNPDPKVHEALEQLYESIDDVELYVGLVAEETKPYGLGLQYTMSRGILSDAVNLIRNDRFLTDDFTPDNLTAWGFTYAQGNPELAGGSIMYQLLLRHIPNFFPPDSIYVWEPFYVPAATTPKPSQWVDPLTTAVQVTTYEGVKSVLENHEAFSVTYKAKIDAISNGYGFLVGWGDTDQAKKDHSVLLAALREDDYQTARQYALENSQRLIAKLATKGKAGQRSVDIVAKVLRNVVPSFFASFFGLALSDGATRDGLLSLREFTTYLEDIFHWIFLDVIPADTVFVGKAAVKAAAVLHDFIMDNIKQRKAKKVHTDADVLGRLLELQRNSKNPKEEGLEDTNIAYNVQNLLAAGSPAITLAAAKTLEFFLRNENALLLDQLSKETKHEAVQKYVLEALRLTSPLGPSLARVAVKDAVISQGKGGADIAVKQGQLVLAVQSAASLDATVFPDPQRFKLDRPEESYLHAFGYGLHHSYARRFALEFISGFVSAITPKTHLAAASPLRFVTREATLSVFPQSYIVRYTDQEADPKRG